MTFLEWGWLVRLKTFHCEYQIVITGDSYGCSGSCPQLGLIENNTHHKYLIYEQYLYNIPVAMLK